MELYVIKESKAQSKQALVKLLIALPASFMQHPAEQYTVYSYKSEPKLQRANQRYLSN